MIDIEELAKNKDLFDKRYKLIKPLSTDGGTADVWLAIDINTIDTSCGEESTSDSGMYVAIKIYRPKNALDIEGEQRFREEYKIVHNCRHTNLLHPTNYSIYKEHPYLVLPYCKNGSSELLIGKDLKEKDIWKYIYDVASGLSYLHSCNPPIIHLDIKPANVLIDDYFNYAITDFGISSESGVPSDEHDFEENSGTMAYMAPERFSDKYIPTIESDIWAFGATLYEILNGIVPFGEEGGQNQHVNNQRIKFTNNKIPKSIQKLILSCLSFNPKDRPTAENIKEISFEQIRPPKKNNKYIVALILTCIVILVSCFYIYNMYNRPSISKDRLIEMQFEPALVLLNCNDKTSVRNGKDIMDSLARQNYVPAMYEMAKIYGWYSDSISRKRKDLLGIKYYTNKDSMRKLLYLPIEDAINSKAKSLFYDITESKDTGSYDSIKADAAYRYAAYLINVDEKVNDGRKWLLKAKQYAEKVNNNDSILGIVETKIEVLDSLIKANKKN